MLTAIRENVRLAPYTTLRVGGIARYFADITDQDHLIEADSFADQMGLPVFVLGGGSNVVIADTGFPGVVLRIGLMGVRFHAEKKDSVLITAAAGEVWDGVVRQAVERNYAGIECLSGIPGLVGGTPIQNVGAYGQEVSETIVSVRVFDRRTRAITDLDNQACGFRYRASIFNTTERDRYVVLAVTYNLRPDGEPSIHYRDLREYFASHEGPPSLSAVREAVLKIRESKSMLVVPHGNDSQSVGSFFKNPVISRPEYEQIKDRARELRALTAKEEIPNFPAENEMVKIPAAWLIERAGFSKGYKSGRVGISSRHTLAIINLSNATATEIRDFAGQIATKVHELFGVTLQLEPVFVGFTGNKS